MDALTGFAEGRISRAKGFCRRALALDAPGCCGSQSMAPGACFPKIVGIVFALYLPEDESGICQEMTQAKYSQEVIVTPEFSFAPSPSMLALCPCPENDAAHTLPEDGGASVCFGEAPRAVTDVTEAWTDRLENLARVASSLDEAEVEEALDLMQADTLSSLYALLDGAGIDRGERLVIGLDGCGAVSVDDHPQREQVLALLEAHPRVAGKLRRIAALALSGRGMRDITRAEQVLTGHDGKGERLFQACLKGSLSHFHLVQK